MPSQLPGNGLAIKRVSASPDPGPGIRSAGPEYAKLIDIARCIGCKGCEVACKEWNELKAEPTFNFGSYQSHEDLSPDTWLLMRFKEIELEGNVEWLITKDACLHCEEPGCLYACPAPGAIIQYENGIVDFNQEQCIGCQYCVSGCPFNIPRFNPETRKVYKCNMCVDRVDAGLEPACVKTCPTNAISWGSKEDMLLSAELKVERLQERGYNEAMVYDPPRSGRDTHDVRSPPRRPARRLFPALGSDREPRSSGGSRRTQEAGSDDARHGAPGGGAPLPRHRSGAAGGGPMKRDDLPRFNYLERVVHWGVGLTFVFLLLTGLAFSHPSLYWITNLVGGGAATRVLHPWIGLLFSFFLLLMFFIWLKDMFLGRGEVAWLKAVRYYATHQKDRVPPVGKYNPGQKVFFWLMSVLGGGPLDDRDSDVVPGGILGVGFFRGRHRELDATGALRHDGIRWPAPHRPRVSRHRRLPGNGRGHAPWTGVPRLGQTPPSALGA